jgi:CheY-like chemotaxis protein
MTQPLALVLYEKLLPGSQLVNRLQDLNYRVQTLSDATRLVESAEQTKPMLVLADLETKDLCAAVGKLKKNPATQHLPVLAFGGDSKPELQTEAQTAGVTLLVSDVAALNHLPECLEQVLRIE